MHVTEAAEHAVAMEEDEALVVADGARHVRLVGHNLAGLAVRVHDLYMSLVRGVGIGKSLSSCFIFGKAQT